MIRRQMIDNNYEIELLARTIWGEARGEGQQGMQAVANVIMNRVNKGGWYGATVEDVVKKPYQFSTWNSNDPNRAKAEAVTVNDVQYWTATKLAALAYNGQLADLTSGATHYHARYAAPSWAKGQTPTAVIGNHVFYKLA